MFRLEAEEAKTEGPNAAIDGLITAPEYNHVNWLFRKHEKVLTVNIIYIPFLSGWL